MAKAEYKVVHGDVHGTLQNHEDRIAKIEHRISYVLGIVSAFAFLLGLLVSLSNKLWK